MTTVSTTAERKAFRKSLIDRGMAEWLAKHCDRDETAAWRSSDMYAHYEMTTGGTATPGRKSIFFYVLSRHFDVKKKRLHIRQKGGEFPHYTLGWVPKVCDGHDIRYGDWLTVPKLERGMRFMKSVEQFVFFCANIEPNVGHDIRWSCNGVYLAFEEWAAKEEKRPVLNSDRRKTEMLRMFKDVTGLTAKKLMVKTADLTLRRASAYSGIEPRDNALTLDEPRWRSFNDSDEGG